MPRAQLTHTAFRRLRTRFAQQIEDAACQFGVAVDTRELSLISTSEVSALWAPIVYEERVPINAVLSGAIPLHLWYFALPPEMKLPTGFYLIRFDARRRLVVLVHEDGTDHFRRGRLSFAGQGGDADAPPVAACSGAYDDGIAVGCCTLGTDDHIITACITIDLNDPDVDVDVDVDPIEPDRA